MKVKVTKEFNWAPDGNHVRTVKVGEVLEGRGAEVALQLKSGEGMREESKPAPAALEAPAPKPAAEPILGKRR